MIVAMENEREYMHANKVKPGIFFRRVNIQRNN